MDLDIFKEPEKKPEGSKKSNIMEIQRYIRKRLNDLGLKYSYNVSEKSTSRYFVITISKRTTVIARIADHRIIKEIYDYNYTFDIYSKWKRHGSIDYLTFLDKLKLMVIKEMKKEEKAKVHKKRKAKLHSIEKREYDDNYDPLSN